MGLIERALSFVFGGGRNVIAETAEVFRENAEAGAQRAQDVQIAAMQSHAEEFRTVDRGVFDRLMDGINRVPRPAMAIGCLALFVAAMVDPVWFAARMTGIALVPDPMWWLLGVIVSFYFGARHQAKGQEFQRSMSQNLKQVPQVVEAIETLENIQKREDDAGADERADARAPKQSAEGPEGLKNPVLDDWRKTAG
ncbi:holin family protein [Shimia sp. R9_1]|uniref:holin family protein n=1 Tax=unclassified Shimia TaxID=2630038 RepID=UPI001ADC9FC1|nr:MULTISPECIES: holin family protein [unclassified Shimia]MBO9396888.1 holin family protein [Shimia sp. R9_2]MBO9408120.1 holin family protein [Shimia sp. R9_1]